MPEFHAPKTHDLGGFTVQRVLPNARRRSIGPFVFFDHIGPALLEGEQPIAVRPHPHIGLATVTYLWEGAMTHRDSLGSVQDIEPGDVNWMTAGRGIVHSERTPQHLRGVAHRFHGLQTWVALPREHEDVEPTFAHFPKSQLPELAVDGASMVVVAGTAFGEHSPVKVLSGTLYVSIDMEPGSQLRLPAEHAERALYPVQGSLLLDGLPLPLNTLAVLEPESTPMLRALTPALVMLLGGEPLDGPRLVWWNFVASDRERIEHAKRDWAAGRFDSVPGETEFIPLPD